MSRHQKPSAKPIWEPVRLYKSRIYEAGPEITCRLNGSSPKNNELIRMAMTTDLSFLNREKMIIFKLYWKWNRNYLDFGVI